MQCINKLYLSCSVDQFRSRLEAVVTCVNGGDCPGILSMEASMGTGSFVVCTCMTDPGQERLGYGAPNLYLRDNNDAFNTSKGYRHYICGYNFHCSFYWDRYQAPTTISTLRTHYRRHFAMHFPVSKLLYFDSHFTDVCS